MTTLTRTIVLMASILCSLGAAHGQAAPVGFVEGGAGYTIPIQSQKSARFGATLHQQFDFSCGSAAVATLLTYHYGHPTTEGAAFEAMFARGDADKIRREGFSLLDLKLFLASQGFEADGFEASLDKLEEAHIPAIALITENGYHHFVVVKGIRSGRVLLGDPSSGTRLVSRERFESSWKNGILFVIHNRQDEASFNTHADWHATPVSPVASAVLRDSLTNLALPRLGPGEF